MRGKLLTVSAITAALAYAAPACGANLVTNGGFETGSLSGWTISGNMSFFTVDNMAHSGSFAGRFGPAGSVGTLSQTLSTVAGQTYTISFWLEDDGGTPSSFEAAFGGNELVALSNPNAFDYTLYSYSLTASSASTLLSFSFRQDPAYFHLDDVSVSPTGVPEPSTWAMMILGLGAAGLALRQRKKSAPTIA